MKAMFQGNIVVVTAIQLFSSNTRMRHYSNTLKPAVYANEVGGWETAQSNGRQKTFQEMMFNAHVGIICMHRISDYLNNEFPFSRFYTSSEMRCEPHTFLFTCGVG
jgi:hypothetical protein